MSGCKRIQVSLYSNFGDTNMIATEGLSLIIKKLRGYLKNSS